MHPETAAIGLRAPAAAGGVGVTASPRLGKSSAPWLSFALTLSFLVALMANLALLFPSVASFAPAQGLAVAALLVVFVEKTLARRPFALVWPESHLLLAFLGAAALSTATALWPGLAAESTLLLAKLVAVYLLLVNTVDTWRRFDWASATLALAALIPTFGTLVSWRAGDVVDGGRARWIGVFANPNDLAFLLVMLFPLLLALAANARGWVRLALGAAVAIEAWVILLTYSRGGLIGLAVVLTLCALRWAGPWMRVPVFLLVAAAFVVGVTQYWERGEGFADLRGDFTIAQRFETIRAGLAMAADRPFLGVGLGCSIVGFESYATDGALTQKALHSHNTPVQALAETGVVGFTLFALLVATGIRRTRKLARAWKLAGRRDRFRAVSALEISIWGFLVCGLAGGYLLSWYPYLVLGLASAACRLPAASTKAGHPAAVPG